MIINEDGSLIYPLQIKVGTKLFWSRRDDKKIFMGAEYLGNKLHEKLAGKKPVAVFHVECGSRGSNYFNKTERGKLIRCIQVPLCGNEQIPWLGWYANGEFGPVGGKNRYFHFSVVLCTLIRIHEQ
jgi:small ligand-binding sensory domain FIST